MIITPIINKINRKYMLIFFLIISSVALYTFTLYLNVVWGIINRIIVGITQVEFNDLDIYYSLFTSMD
jgi:hypothetical protein